MPQIINTNIASLNAQRNLNKSQSANQTALQRLSSGLRINSAKDDAAGLAISTRFNSQIRGLNVAIRNAGDGISLAQTAEGALGSMNDNLQRIRELAVQSANATNSDVDRDALQAEVSQLVAEISRTADETAFNGRNLLDGSFSATFQIGANAGQTLDVSIAELTAKKLGASDSVGLSAQGTSSGLQNGDLIINGVAITPSKAEDDTSSTANAEASAIAKVAAINRAYDQTGVQAKVNVNTVSGAEMTAASATGTLTLNNVDISLSTTTSGSQTRAGVVEAINAVADQTGVTAVNSDTDAGGITLVAADGRNISISATGGLTAANTGLALNATPATTETYEGGFTLVADGDVAEIKIEGGDGTGNGNLANAGLQRGTYETTSAQLATTVVSSTDGVSITNPITLSGAQSTAFAASVGEFFGIGNVSANGAAGGEVLTIVASDGQTVTISTAAASTITLAASTGFGADVIAAGLSAIDGIEASAETQIKITNLAMSTGSLSFFDSGTAGQNLGTIAFTSTSTLETMAASINALTTGNLVADFVNSVDSGVTGGELYVTDVNGNTLVSYTTAANTTLDIATKTGAGTAAFTAAATLGDASSVAVIVSVGYLKDTDITSEGIDNVNFASNLTGATAGNLTTGLASVFFSTSGYIAGSAASGTNSADQTVTKALEGLGDGDLLINGVAIQAADPVTDTASSVQASDGGRIQTSLKEASAIAVAEAINAVSEETGVTAEVQATKVVGGTGSNTTSNPGNYIVGDTGRLYINGVDVGVMSLVDDGTGAIDTEASRTAAIDAINAKAGQTGVTAEDNGVSITLTAADGRNISVAIDNDEANNTGTGTGFGALFGLDAAVDGIGEADIGTSTSLNTTGTRGDATEAATYQTTYGTVLLSSAKAIEIGVNTDGADELTALGLTAGTYGGGTSGQFLTEIDISTFEGAQAAITAIDNAIGAVASQRADLGAIQNRIESTVSNLAVTSENLSAANSRIQDADFAAETAELSRTQVLQQAGISILAQANQLPQQVLSLLG